MGIPGLGIPIPNQSEDWFGLEHHPSGMVKSVGFGINLMWGIGERKRYQIYDLGSGMEVVVSETDLGNIGRSLVRGL